MTNPRRPGDELAALDTERSQPGTRLELLDVRQLVARQLDHDSVVAGAVEAAAGQVADALETIVARLEKGGRMLYVGAGTPGRLAVLDAAECLPTFGVGPEVVDAVVAGGAAALTRAVEGAEDDAEGGASDVTTAGVGQADVVVAISASGRTPYVLGAVRAARRAGAATVGVVNNARTELAAAVDHPIETLTGPELVAGSTRLKAGTAQKLVLNMLSTITMIRLGKVHGTLMVDVLATNEKLEARARRIVVEATGASPEEAEQALAASGGHAKTAIAALLLGVPADEAAARLATVGGRLALLMGEAP
ncbi:N-acetylmuramic acid 6-phosphate etherase [Nocardioides sp. GCM10027113]|uniref:N-acetylmuramic acid 6-phosphate etherase n=1 Tax=unclassified Nocardioides TaxID=2615069 RepID=UPI00360FE990